jgi:Protein of unknown function (DUF3450)
LILAGVLPLSAAPDPLDTVQKAAQDWVKTRTETVRLETDWSSQRELLETTIRALEQRAQRAEEKRDLLKAQTARDREEIESVEARNKASTDGLQNAEVGLEGIQEKIRHLRPALPPRLSAALELPYRSLADPVQTPANRMQAVFTILNRCLLFNRIVTSGEEALTPEGETAPRMLEVLYWGLSRGYALDRKAGKAWLGSPGPSGWKWEAHSESAPQVAALIAIYNDKAEPDFVILPAAIAHPATEMDEK